MQKENPQKRTVILIISFTALLGLLALVALVVVVRRASRSSTLSKEVSEDGQPQASAGAATQGLESHIPRCPLGHPRLLLVQQVFAWFEGVWPCRWGRGQCSQGGVTAAELQ